MAIRNEKNLKFKNYKNQYFIEKPNIFLPKIKKKNKRNHVINIGYILQSNYNLNYSNNLKNNDPFSLFLLRTKLLKKINLLDRVIINASSYNINFNEFACAKTMEISKSKNLLKVEILKSLDIIKKSDILIFESASTSLIQTILSKKKCPIFLLKNPFINYFKEQNKIINKSFHIFKNFQELNYILDLYLKDKFKEKNLINIQKFTNDFYGSKSKNQFINTLKSVL